MTSLAEIRERHRVLPSRGGSDDIGWLLAKVDELSSTLTASASTPGEIALTEAAGRVQAFLDQRAQMRGLDAQMIQGANHAWLTVDDLTALVLAVRVAAAGEAREAGALREAANLVIGCEHLTVQSAHPWCEVCEEWRQALERLAADAESKGCDCTELCSMGPTCPGGMLARLPGAGCWRTNPKGGVPGGDGAPSEPVAPPPDRS